MKAIAAFLLLCSSATFATERCEITTVFRSSTRYQTLSDANRFCDLFTNAQIPCRITQVNTNIGFNFGAEIDFRQVFVGTGQDTRTARTNAYRQFFQNLESRRAHTLPIGFGTAFNCPERLSLDDSPVQADEILN